MSFTPHLTDSYGFSQSKIVSVDNDDGKATFGCSLATRSHKGGGFVVIWHFFKPAALSEGTWKVICVSS